MKFRVAIMVLVSIMLVIGGIDLFLNSSRVASSGGSFDRPRPDRKVVRATIAATPRPTPFVPTPLQSRKKSPAATPTAVLTPVIEIGFSREFQPTQTTAQRTRVAEVGQEFSELGHLPRTYVGLYVSSTRSHGSFELVPIHGAISCLK